MLGSTRYARAGLIWSPLRLCSILNEFCSGSANGSGRLVSIAIPPLSWVDIHREVPNKIANFDDVFQFLLAFKGDPYPFADPMFCPQWRSRIDGYHWSRSTASRSNRCSRFTNGGPKTAPTLTVDKARQGIAYRRIIDRTANKLFVYLYRCSQFLIHRPAILSQSRISRLYDSCFDWLRRYFPRVVCSRRNRRLPTGDERHRDRPCNARPLATAAC